MWQWRWIKDQSTYSKKSVHLMARDSNKASTWPHWWAAYYIHIPIKCLRSNCFLLCLFLTTLEEPNTVKGNWFLFLHSCGSHNVINTFFVFWQNSFLSICTYEQVFLVFIITSLSYTKQISERLKVTHYGADIQLLTTNK